MPAKLTFSYIEKFFKDNDCTLLATEYVNSITKMPYICSCGNKSNISYGNFQQGKRCRKCAVKKNSSMKKLTFEYVQRFFEKHNCTLLATSYKNNLTKMPYICSCGNKSEIVFGHFQQGKRCKKCRINKLKEKFKLSFEYVQDFFEANDCVLLSTEYINTKTPLSYICSCGNIGETNFGNFQLGARCQECKVKKIKEKQKLPFEYVQKFFEAGGCILLSTSYENARMKLSYICSCGNEAKIRFCNFEEGHRCAECSPEKIRLNRQTARWKRASLFIGT